MKKNIPFQIDHGNTDSSTWFLPEGALARLGRGSVYDIAFTPDDSYLAVTSHFGLWWYDVSTRAVLTLWGAETAQYPVAISNCDTWVATGRRGYAHQIGIWDVSSGTCLATLPRAEKERIGALVFSPDSKCLAVCGSYRGYRDGNSKDFFSVEIYSLPENLQADDAPVHLESKQIYAGAFTLDFSPDSRLLAFAAPTGEPLPFQPGGYPIQDPNRGLRAHHIAICDVTTGQYITTLSGLDDVGSTCFSPCGQFFAASSDFGGPVHEWKIPEDLSPDGPPWQLHNVDPGVGNLGFSYDVCYSPEGTLVTFDNSLADNSLIVKRLDQNGTHHPPLQCERLTFSVDFAVDVWKIGEESFTYVKRGHGFPAGTLIFSQDDKTLHEICRWDGVCSWDIAHPDEPLHIFKPLELPPDSEARGEQYLSLGTSPDGKHFVTSGDENSVRLWELGIDTPIVSFPIQDEAYSGVYSPTANLLACRDKAGKIYIWDIATGEIYDAYMSEDSSGYNDLTFSPDGAYLICHPGQIYDVVQRKPLGRYSSDDGIKFFAFSQNSSQIWCDWPRWDNETIDLWDIQRDEEVLELPKPKWWQDKNIDVFTLSTCGQYIACSPDTWALEGYICVWDIRKGTEPIVTFEVKEGISALTFSADNTLLASAGTSGAMLLWDMKPYL